MRDRAVRLPGSPSRGHHRDLRGKGDPTHVAALRVELRLPESRSLKSKRALVKPILERARQRFSVAAAEVDHHEQWQRACLGMATVSSTPGHAEEILDEVERFVWSRPDVEIISTERGWLEMES
ncbi:MAG TPA: DUF503 domain-containing protein [Acidimicrobiales bacterium]|nr:DUF503 domain-containing protein [Acidimicrobiales bacterium]